MVSGTHVCWPGPKPEAQLCMAQCCKYNQESQPAHDTLHCTCYHGTLHTLRSLQLCTAQLHGCSRVARVEVRSCRSCLIITATAKHARQQAPTACAAAAGCSPSSSAVPASDAPAGAADPAAEAAWLPPASPAQQHTSAQFLNCNGVCCRQASCGSLARTSRYASRVTQNAEQRMRNRASRNTRPRTSATRRNTPEP